MTVLYRLLLTLFFLAIAGHVFAATPAQIDSARSKGLAWLISNQTGEGRWASPEGMEIQSAASALDAFQNAGIQQGYPYSSAKAWLGNAEAYSTDSISLQIMSLHASGSNVSSLVSRLLNQRFELTKSWGAYPGFDGSFPDTSLALDAILKTGTTYADTGTTLGTVVGAQNGDGGWPYYSKQPSTASSRLIPSAYNVIMLSRYRAIGWGVDSYLTNGVNWLVSQQKGDGGFAEDVSSANGSSFETALVSMALQEAQAANNAAALAASANLTQAEDFLVATQQTDGAWDNSAFHTAFALKSFPITTMSDSDGDGLPDSVETEIGTNPSVADGRNLVKGNGQSIEGIHAPTFIYSANYNEFFTTALTASGGTPPYAWSLEAGGLPSGVTLQNDGTLSGVPGVAGDFVLSYRVTDSVGDFDVVIGELQIMEPQNPIESVPGVSFGVLAIMAVFLAWHQRKRQLGNSTYNN